MAPVVVAAVLCKTPTTTSAAKGIVFKAGASNDSTTLFQVQNSSGTDVLNVDTTNSRIGIGTASPVATLNVLGSTLLQQGATTSLTVSGNEITDATRTTNTQGDGKTSPDSSYGVWEGTTNLVTNGGFETNLNQGATWFDNGSGSTLTRITTDAKFGTASMQITNTSAPTGASMGISSAVVAGSPVTASAWIKATTGSSINVGVSERTSGDVFVSNHSQSVAATGSWQRVSVTYTPAAGNTLARVNVSGPQSVSLLVDGVQLEQKAIATPYVETNGATASRSAARVQAPAAALNATQGWFAVRTRMGWGASSAPNSFV